MGPYMGYISAPWVLFSSLPTDYASIIMFALLISVTLAQSTHPAWTIPLNIRVPFTLAFFILMAHRYLVCNNTENSSFPRPV